MSGAAPKKLPSSGLRRTLSCAALFAALSSAVFLYDHLHLGRLDPFEKIDLQNILMAKTDSAGDVYIIDNGTSRIVRMNRDGTARYEINGGPGGVFYNAEDIAAEDGRSLFVHEVEWDSSGMSLSAERILEFDKESGSSLGELYRLDRGATDASPELSAQIALQGLRFEDGKLWFVRKEPDFFALYSLVPGENAVVERLVSYRDALSTLGDFSLDIPAKRIFFADKAGVLRVSIPDETNEAKVVFNPVSGTSAREFSLPYKLSFDGSRLYFSDIGRRAVMRLDGENSAEAVFGGWEGPDLPTLYHFAHSGGGFLTLASDSAVVGISPDGGEIFRSSSLPAGRRIVLLRICFWGLALVVLSSLIFVIAAVVRFVLSGRMSGKESLLSAIIIGMTVASALIAPPVLNWVRSEEEGKIVDRLSYIMEISPKILDTGALAEINTPQDYNGPAYRRFKRS
ncbi:MAG: hypothetical protein LBQ56_01075, partial [Synergistaceae bacterium]|nr:hypothetical protein [Synergistaceae bacterium]